MGSSAGLPEDGRGAMRDSVVTVGSARLRDQARKASLRRVKFHLAATAGFLVHIADSVSFLGGSRVAVERHRTADYVPGSTSSRARSMT
jgi:hypothetical protein